METEHKRSSVDIDDLLSRAVGEVIDPGGIFKEKLIKKQRGEYNKEIIIKFGADPTRPDIHLGHAAVFRKLRKFQDLGCKVVFLVGDFTARIGDPTGRDKIRPEIEQADVEENVKTYLAQVDKILHVERDEHGAPMETPLFSWISNGEWFYGVSDLVPPQHSESVVLVTQSGAGQEQRLTVPRDSFLGKAVYYEATRMQKKVLHNQGKLHDTTVRGLLWTLKHITHTRLIERDMFQKRLAEGRELYMHEMLYPVLQGIDSCMLMDIYGSCDAEVGGTDQTFNMLMGREVMKANNQEQQAVLSFKLLPGLDGKEKMSKSLNNYIAINDEPDMMFGKIMSLPDTVLEVYFELCTFTPMEEVRLMLKDIEKGKVNPRDVKARLGREIVAMYHGEERGEKAEENFTKAFSGKEMPEQAPELRVQKGMPLFEALLNASLASSKSEARRLVAGGGVSAVGGECIADPAFALLYPLNLRVGKHHFLKIIIE